jgi:hypothetical protein
MINFTDIKNTVTKKSFIGAFIFALSLWAYAAMNDTYSTVIEVPVQGKTCRKTALLSIQFDSIAGIEARVTAGLFST